MISNMLRFPMPMFDDELDSLFYLPTLRRRRNFQAAFPAINIGTSDKSVDVYAFLPGMNAEDIELVIEKDMLSVSGNRRLPKVEGGQGEYRQERFEGDFKRVITLPETVDTDRAEAVYKNGVLHVSIAKRELAQPRQIKVSDQ